jgi:Uma2 family endonuclease
MSLHDRPSAARYKLTVADYLTLDEAGAFSGARTELIDGEVYLTSPKNRSHVRAVRALGRAFDAVLEGSGMMALPGASVAVAPNDTPEPDLVVTTEPEGDGLVPIGSVRLVVEVSDATLRRNLVLKHKLYATAGVPEFWVVDLVARVVRQMWAPADGAYAEVREIAFGAPVVVATLPLPGVATDAL